MHAQGLLHANGVDGDDAQLMNLSMLEATRQLQEGKIDVAFLVTSA